ncbi:Basic 7S globulin [Morus notabilis]|uniref:Basic 7S globulin n=1 Tax=Morus notabilis TaxID=981085 RepID=W9SJ18_9ROSA|nr:basic 7S globulin [Morus notabilis]EXC31441.1 Basic 7S globulin [Morus notabilis]
MASSSSSSFQFLLLLVQCLFFFYNGTLSNAQITPILPITKDASTLQYLTSVDHGNSLLPTKLVLDLGGPFLWMDCGSRDLFSPGRLISRGSIRCLAAKSSSRRNSDDKSDVCAIFSENRIGKVRGRGDVAEDILAVDLVDPSKAEEIRTVGKYLHNNFLFACAEKSLLSGLASGAKGILGLGRARISLPSQISSGLDSKWEFTLCLSSSNGVVLHENGRYMSSYFGSEISNSLVYTPLILSGEGDSQNDYFINLKSISIGGKRLSFDVEKAKLSTIVPYTTMESSIYAVFVKAYERAALSMNMTRVESVAPFGLCFGVETVPKTRFGPEVPDVELGLQSELVKWRIHGRNLMVKVSDEVVCLGFLDGGLELGASIVLGGFQLEDVVLHFDVGSSMMGFSPLLKWKRSCSDFGFGATPLESL